MQTVSPIVNFNNLIKKKNTLAYFTAEWCSGTCHF
jgi:hypothetical protein